ncbi:Histone-lysine N-methyltransferase SETD2 [Echinococcus granulosus]|uniref:Histone-lysine N-methyltransferase SETD2 n=1 Tax=Echinococcus granulosus TaxID=6210 RepID=W6V3V6_ECHGR|nr:Histone-lysine N-methyltransferase SETD2 [Echinococcus granulosus]EUB60744.1 Histone-lysine N-methyltransferase SETD2 [Echinococcus granulosus]
MWARYLCRVCISALFIPYNLDNVMQDEIAIFSSTAIYNIPLPPEKVTPVEDLPPHRKRFSPPPPPPPPIDNPTDVSNKSDPSILSFRIKAVSKRSRPGTLRTGVLPTKAKHPEIEAKTELFKPTKEDELEIMAELNNESVAELQNSAQTSLTAISEAILARINNAAQGERQLSAVLREINKVNETSSSTTDNKVSELTIGASTQPDSSEEPSKSQLADPQAASTVDKEKSENPKVRSRSRSRTNVMDLSNRRKRRASSEKRKSRSKSLRRSRSPKKSTKRRRSKSPEKTSKRSRSRSRSARRRSRSRSRSTRRRSRSRSLHRSRVRSPVRRRRSRSSRRRKSPLSPRRRDRDSSRSKYKRSDVKRSSGSSKRRSSKSRKRETTVRITKKESGKLPSGKKDEKPRSKNNTSTKQSKSKTNDAEKSKSSEQKSKKTAKATRSLSSNKDERSKGVKSSSKLFEAFSTESHSEDGVVQSKRPQKEENGSVLGDRVGPHTPESPSHAVPTTKAPTDVVTQKCTALSEMVLNEGSAAQLRHDAGTDKTEMHPSYSSTSSTTCHTPSSSTSSSSSTVSDCTASPKKCTTGKLGTRKRLTSAVYESDDSSPNARYRLRRRKTVHQARGDAGTPLQDYSCSKPSPEVAELLRPFQVKPIEHFARTAGVPTPDYIHVLENDYALLEDRLRREGINLASEVLSLQRRGGGGDWVCDCAVPSADELLSGKLACGQGCINRAVYIECGSRCPAHAVCSNRQFQLRLYASTEPFYCGPEKGWGLRALQTISKGTFIVEYAGEVIDFPEFRRRIRQYEKAKRVHHYFMSLGPDHFIDAGAKGNWARFVNHSCEPNAETQKWMVNGRIKIGFFAICDIPAGEEITIDYQFVQFGVTEQKCYCGTPSCSGIMGATSKQLQDKVRLKDTRAVERRIIQLLTGKTLQTAMDVTFLIQVMVQEYLTRYTRLELLKLLVHTETESYLKLFRQYNGLELLASYMCDTAPTDWELKHQILLCLDHIPITEQKQVQTDSSLMEFVRQWTMDPRYCRSRNTETVSSTEPKASADDSKCLDESQFAELPKEIDEINEQREQQKQQPDANTVKVFSPEEEKAIIEDIRQLAERILSRWLKLPVETYRIPRLEREETEQSILQSSCSSLISWDVSSTQDGRRNHQDCQSEVSVDQNLSRLERRAQFEAAVAAAAATNPATTTGTTEITSSTCSSSSSKDLRSLLLKTLSRQAFSSEKQSEGFCAALQQATSEISAKICEFNAKNDTNGLIAYLQKLAGEDPETKLEFPWRSAVDSKSGLTYYYNSVTREVRWDAPVPKKEPSEDRVKKHFIAEIYAVNLKILKPFRLPNCITGRLESDEDMKYFAFAFANRELARRRSDEKPRLNRQTVDRLRRKITRYLTSKGEVYVRSNMSSVSNPTADGCDMEIDSEDEGNNIYV